MPQPTLATLSSGAASLRKSLNHFATKDILLPDFPECHAELFNTKCINNGIDCRVAVAEDDGDVYEEYRLLARRAEESDAVKDVKWKPADCEEEEDNGEGLGQFQLFAKVTSWIRVACCHL